MAEYRVERISLDPNEDQERVLTEALDKLYSPDRGKTSGTELLKFKGQEFSYEAKFGEIIHDTYLPSSYNRYFVNSRNSRRTNSQSEVFQRLGTDNKYPLFLKDLTNKSSLHKSAWLAVSNLAYGHGISPKSRDSEAFVQWLKQVGVNRSFIKFSLKQISRYGGAYAYLRFFDRRQRRGGKKLSLAKVSIAKYENHRIGKPETDPKSKFLGRPQYIWRHPNYTLPTPDKKYFKGVPFYYNIQEVVKNPQTLVQEDKTTPYFDNQGRRDRNKNWYCSPIWDPNLDSESYPTPYYQADTLFDSAILDAALSAFDTASIKNGLMARYVITVPYSGIDAIKRSDPDKYNDILGEVRNKVKSELTGEDNGGVALVVMQDVATAGTVPVPIKIQEIPNTNTSNIHKIFDQRKYRNIMTAWGVTDSRLIGAPPIFGMGLSDQSDILKASESIFKGTFVGPEIAEPFENWVNDVLKPIWLFETGRKKSDAEICLRNKNLFAATPSDYIMDRFMSEDEIRDRYNLPPLTDEQRKEIEARNLRKEKASTAVTDFSGGGSGDNDNDNRRRDERKEKALEKFMYLSQEMGVSLDEIFDYALGMHDLRD